MPRSRSSNLSEETLDALLEALGLSPVVHEDLKNAAPISRMDVSYVDITQDPSHDHRPKTPFSQIEEVSLDEARLFGQNYLSDFDISSEFDEDSSDCDIDEIQPSRPESPLDNFDTVITPIAHRPMRASIQHQHSLSSTPTYTFPTSLSPSPSCSSSDYGIDSPPPSPDETIVIKAAHNASIIVVRTPRNVSFADLRQRLYRKFVYQEGILLSPSFSVVNVLPPSSSNSTLRASSSYGFHNHLVRSGPASILRARSESAASAYDYVTPEKLPQVTRRVSFAERTEMRFINRESDWRRIISSHTGGSKVTLRILDTPV